MADFMYNEAKRAQAEGEIDFGLPDDFRAILVMAATTFDTDYDIDTMAGVATPAYFDGANHDTTNGHTIAGEAITEITGISGYAKLDGTDLTFTALGAGAGDAVGMVIFKWVTNLASSIPIFYVDSGFPFNGNGGDVTIQWHTDGIAKLGG